MMAIRPTRIFETVLYAENLAAAERFYRDAVGLEVIGRGDHIAFGAKPEDLDAWRQQLRKAGVSIEREVDWDEGGRSIYFRDPAGNVVELAPPTLWSGGWEF